MKFLRAIFVFASFICASAAIAAPITYDFAAYDFQAYQGNTAPNANVFGSFTLDGSIVTNIDLTIGAHTYAANEVAYDWLLGGVACATYCIGWGSDDFWLTFDVNSLTFGNMYYAVSGIDDIWWTTNGTISVGTAHVPESSALILMLIGMFGFAARRFKASK